MSAGPVAIYVVLCLIAGRGLVRSLYRPGELRLWEGAAFVLPLAPLVPLPIAFVLESFGGVPIGRSVLIGLAAALAIVTHLMPGPAGAAEDPRSGAGDRGDPGARRTADEVERSSERVKRLPLDPATTGLKLLLLSVVIFWALSPLFSYDLFLYHLPFAEELARTGHLPTDVSGSLIHMTRAYPPLVYMAYGGCWVLCGGREHVSPRALAIAFHLGIVALVMAGAGGGRRGLSAGWLLAASPPMVAFLHLIGSDLPMAYFCLAWALLVHSHLQRGRRSDLVLASLHLSLALWTKYQSLTFFVAGLAAIVTAGGLPAGARRRLVGAHLVALALFVPFLARNAMLFGNPVYPALPELLGGIGLDRWTLDNLVSVVQAPPGWTRIATGLIMLGLVPAFWLLVAGRDWSRMGRRDPVSRFFATLIVSFLAIWTVLWIQPLSHPERFLLPVVAVAAWLAAPLWEGLAWFPAQNGRPLLVVAVGLATFQALYFIGVGWLGWGAFQEPLPAGALSGKALYRLVGFLARDVQPLWLALALLLNRRLHSQRSQALLVLVLSGPLIFQCADKLRWMTQKISRHGWVAHLRYDPDRLEYPWMDAHLPEGARLLTVGGLPDLLSRPAVPLESSAQRDLSEAPTEEEFRVRLTRRGISHVFVDEVMAGHLPLYTAGVAARALHRPDLFDRLFVEPGRASVYRVRP
ncbi:MAG: glycosyltransferase family 39 protein [Candidatus Riflebacteria bacterium]|nr:glycosyltransferase family 39 protein [Candidatus Riflebacteria bacterium]